MNQSLEVTLESEPQRTSFNRDTIIKQLIFNDCCKTKPLTSSLLLSSNKDNYNNNINQDVILELSLGVWCNYIDEKLIVSITNNYKYIALSLKAGPIITPEVLLLLSKYVSPKLVEIAIIDCTHLTWQNHVRKILEPASFVEIINLQKNTWVLLIIIIILSLLILLSYYHYYYYYHIIIIITIRLMIM